MTLPHEMGEVQKAFNLRREGAFRISVKNPKINTPVPGGAGTGLKQKAEFPEERELSKLLDYIVMHPDRDLTHRDQYKTLWTIFAGTH